MNPFDDPEARYRVLVNAEEQYSLWRVDIAVPDGWTVVLPDGGLAECLEHIDAHWTDMRPLSLRQNRPGPVRS
ncbi:MbtH family protein [Streptomyces sp. NPDC046909]|uniref:MbtH family protein n=1 Tax=Streptomyces sp. NPDC046909 TaxID=3155617 RepID=UPI0033F208D7